MNERIEKLGEEVDLLGEFTPTKIPGRYVGYITEEKILKFAELIVRECLDVMDTTSKKALEQFTYIGDDVPTFHHQFEIKKHFGIEE